MTGKPCNRGQRAPFANLHASAELGPMPSSRGSLTQNLAAAAVVLLAGCATPSAVSDEQLRRVFSSYERRSVADMLVRFGHPASIGRVAGQKWYLWAYRTQKTERAPYQVFGDYPGNTFLFDRQVGPPSDTVDLQCLLAALVDDQEVVKHIDWRGTRTGCTELAGI